MNQVLTVISLAIVLFLSSTSVAESLGTVVGAKTINICDSKIEDGYVQVMKGTGSAARNPTIGELFDAFNKTESLIADLKYQAEREHKPSLRIEAPEMEPIAYSFDTTPKKAVGGDRFCKAKKETRSGYDCRIDFLRSKDRELGGMPRGLNTGVEIKLPLADPELVSRVSKAFGCDEVVEISGKPVGAGARSSKPGAPAIRLVPAATGTKQ